jgi:hypothetical protein
MDKVLTFALLLLSLLLRGQDQGTKKAKLATEKYAGSYSFGTDIEKENIGNISVFPETDSTILFYVDVNRGAPSYNMGALYGRAKIINGRGTFYVKLDTSDKGCKWSFKFSKNMLSLKTVDEYYDCGFGHAVYADGDYKLYSNKIPVNFDDLEGHSIPFKTTTPEDYYKD